MEGIQIYLYTKFHSNRRNFLWTDGRMDIFPPNIIRSTFGSRPKNTKEVTHLHNRLLSGLIKIMFSTFSLLVDACFDFVDVH